MTKPFYVKGITLFTISSGVEALFFIQKKVSD
jgi:hypothetical protein